MGTGEKLNHFSFFFLNIFPPILSTWNLSVLFHQVWLNLVNIIDSKWNFGLYELNARDGENIYYFSIIQKKK